MKCELSGLSKLQCPKHNWKYMLTHKCFSTDQKRSKCTNGNATQGEALYSKHITNLDFSRHFISNQTPTTILTYYLKNASATTIKMGFI